MERFTTLHPDPSKNGVKIDRTKYELIHKAIIHVLDEMDECSFSELTRRVVEDLGDSFEGSVSWYVVTVKLDMEARKEIVCDRSGKRQTIRR